MFRNRNYLLRAELEIETFRWYFEEVRRYAFAIVETCIRARLKFDIDKTAQNHTQILFTFLKHFTV